MSQYYLMAQLPSLDALSDSMPLPITEERFLELCDRLLGKKALAALHGLTLIPGREAEKAGFSLIDAWNDGERKLRLALGVVRAGKMKKTFDGEDDPKAAELLQVARTAVESEDPLAAEQFLNSYRLNFLESLRPADAFCDNAVFYYGLKLKLLKRMRSFDEAKGRQAYKNIYDSIMSGDGQEVEQ